LGKIFFLRCKFSKIFRTLQEMWRISPN